MRTFGSLRHLSNTTATGFVRIAVASLDKGCDPVTLAPEIRIYAAQDGAVEGQATFQRYADPGQTLAVYTFRIALTTGSKLRRGGLRNALRAVVCVQGDAFDLVIPDSVQLEFALSTMSANERSGFFSQATIRNSGHDVVRALSERANSRKLQQRKKLAVIITAEEADAKFRITYDYYRTIVSPNEIYITAPYPENFAPYAASTILAVPPLRTDPAISALYLSHLVTGLQAYYEWTLLAKIGEIVAPDPRSGRSFLDQLKRCRQDIIRPLGFGVDGLDDLRSASAIDNGEEPNFVGRLSSMLCRPSVSRVNISYSDDLASCHQKAPLAVGDQGFLSFSVQQPSIGRRGNSVKVKLSSPEVTTFIRAFNASLVADEQKQLWRADAHKLT